ncbi:hypothetical protein GGR53DRAFT_470229 [Hypoxylon sp. FL1150]|nr:hypothetical protein GGR53DRAFT_470229 [Hypoxylon sp. FL1150]
MIKFVRVDYKEVLQDQISTPRTSTYAHQFNTCYHPARDSPNQLVPTESPYSFKAWLPVILGTRCLKDSDCQVISLSGWNAKFLLEVTNASIPAGRVNLTYQEEVSQTIEPYFKGLKFPPSGLFMRLDACSAKDGVQRVPGQLSLHSVKDIILRLVTSTRARNALANNGAPEDFQLFFLPFNPRIIPAREYRIFCPPTRPGTVLNVAAISQYQWHKPWLLKDLSKEEAIRVSRQITSKCCQILTIINGAVEKVPGITEQIHDLLISQGLTFDVFYDEESYECHLIELNVFGIRSAAGSCLYQWKNDLKVLYNPGHDADIEFRITY